MAGLDPAIEEFTAELNMKLGNLPVGAAAKDVLDPRFVDAAHQEARPLQEIIQRWQNDGPRASDGMVVYDDVSKFFPVRIRPGQKERPELMVALDRVNATVRKGELVTLLGPSGCGKTTLLRMIAGLIAADEGRIAIEGTPVTAPRKDACMVFQNFGLLPWRTVLGNVEFPLELDGVGAGRARASWRGTSSSSSGSRSFAEHYPHELSGGMQQRVGIARALMRKPHPDLHGRAVRRARRADARAAAGGLPADLVADAAPPWSSSPTASTRRCSCPTASSCSTPRPAASDASSSRRSPPTASARDVRAHPEFAQLPGASCARCSRSEP